LKIVATERVLFDVEPPRKKYWPALTASQSLTCMACVVISLAVWSKVAVRISTAWAVMLKVGNVRKVASMITPQLPAPPPRMAQNTRRERDEE
jgi:hypothetical protein